ncbi:MAG: hypothetical protein CMJ48_07405, partial [Planctomycetaceae bacterium]|nr:hypothetical protein [Planctomycetaceae bacterium]
MTRQTTTIPRIARSDQPSVPLANVLLMPDGESQTDATATAQSTGGTGVVGSCLLFLGIFLVTITAIHSVSSLPLPFFWHANRNLWYLLGFACFATGWKLLRTRPDEKAEERTHWRPNNPGPRFTSLVLYTRRECQLCDEAKEQLHRYADCLPELREQDVDAQPELRERFDHCVPVIEIDGKVRFRGRIDERLLRRLI